MRCSVVVVLLVVFVGCGGEDSDQATSVAVSPPKNVRNQHAPKPIETSAAQKSAAQTSVAPEYASAGQAAALPPLQSQSNLLAAAVQKPPAAYTAGVNAFPAPIDVSSNPPAAPFSGQEQADDVVVPDEIQRLGDPRAESYDDFLKQIVAYPSAAIRKRLVKKITARSVDQSYGQKAIHVLRGALLDPSMDVRLAATQVVANWGALEASLPFAKQAVPELALNLQHDDELLARATIRSLRNFEADAASALPHLRWKLRQVDNSDSMVFDLMRVLGEMGPAAAEAVPELEAIAMSSGSGNGIAWDMIAKIGDQAAIRRGLESDDASVQLHSSGAAEFLENLEPETTVVLRALLKHDESMIRGNAALAVCQTTPMTKDLATEVSALLKDKDAWPRAHAAEGLAAIQPQFNVALRALMAGLEDEDDNVTRACHKALANYSSTGKLLMKVTFGKARNEQALLIDNDSVLPVFDDYFAVLEDKEADVFERVCAYLSLQQVSWDSKATEEQKKKVEDFRKTLLDPSVPFQLRIAALKNIAYESKDTQDLTRKQFVKGINGCVLRDLRIRCLSYCSEQAIEEAFPEVLKVIASEQEAEEKLHYTAISTLHRYGKLAGDATPYLLKLLNSKDMQPTVLRALGDIAASPELTVPAINRIIAEDDQGRSTALVALAKISLANNLNLNAVAETTKKYWDQDKFNPRDRIDDLTLALGDSAGPIVPNVIKLFNTNISRYDLIKSIDHIGPPAKSAAPKLISMINPDGPFPLEIIQALRKIKLDGDEFAKIAEAQLANTQNRAAMLEELAKFGSAAKSTVPSIIGCLQEGDQHVRYAAINALGAMGEAGRAANKQLQAIAEEENGNFAHCAAITLIRLYPENERVLAFCLNRIGYIRDYEAITLKKQLGDNFADLKKAAKASKNEEVQRIAITLESVQ